MQPKSPTARADDIEIAALLRAVNSRKGWILGMAALVAAAVYVGLSFVTPLYTSQARILIEREENTYRRPADAEIRSDQRGELDQEAIASQVQVLLSRDLAQSIVKELNLDNDPEFNRKSGFDVLSGRLLGMLGLDRSPTEQDARERAVDAFLDRLSVYQLQSSRVIAIEFQSRNPKTAAKAANTLAEFYLTWQQGEKLKQTKEASAWLSEQIKVLTKKVEQADIAAEKFRSSSGLLEGSNNTTLDTQQLSELNSQIILAKAQRTEAEARAGLIQKMLKEQGNVDGATDVLKSRLIQRLLEQKVRVQRELAEVSVNLLPSHPRIKGLKSEIADLERQIKEEARKVVASLENEAQIAGAREASLRESLAELKRTAAKGNENQIKLRALEREAKANRQLLESYLARYRDASSRSDSASVPAHASVVSRAHVSNKPSFPKKGPISLIAFAAVALLGFAQTVARELILPQDSTGPVQGSYANATQGNTGPTAPDGIVFANSSRKIAGQITASAHKRLVLTPVSSQEEGPVKAVELARSVASTGSTVILVDATAGGDRIACALDLPDAPGINEMLSGDAAFEDTVRRDPESPLQVISGAWAEGANHSPDTEQLASILHALERAYDRVILYAGPQQAATLMQIGRRTESALIMLCGESISNEDALWHADRILGDMGSLAKVYILAHNPRSSWLGKPLPFAKKAAAI